MYLDEVPPLLPGSFTMHGCWRDPAKVEKTAQASRNHCPFSLRLIPPPGRTYTNNLCTCICETVYKLSWI